jgi:hypothetical protein
MSKFKGNVLFNSGNQNIFLCSARNPRALANPDKLD